LSLARSPLLSNEGGYMCRQFGRAGGKDLNAAKDRREAMGTSKAWRMIRVSVLAALSLSTTGVSYAAGQGTTIGTAAFQAKGEVKEHKPGLVVWDGTFVGVSVTDAKNGPLHNAAWECTGESVLQDGQAYRSGGFCLVSDKDGDTINLLWERQDVPGTAAVG